MGAEEVLAISRDLKALLSYCWTVTHPPEMYRSAPAYCRDVNLMICEPALCVKHYYSF